MSINERVASSSRSIWSYQTKPHIPGENPTYIPPFSNPLARAIADLIFTKPFIGLDKPSHTGEFVARPKNSLPESTDFRRLRIPADLEAFPIKHWWDWLRAESRWGWKNHAIVGLDLDQLAKMDRAPQSWHLSHTYDDDNWIQRWIGILEPKQLVRVGRGPKNITLMAVSTSGDEMPLELISFIKRDDPQYKHVPWI